MAVKGALYRKLTEKQNHGRGQVGNNNTSAIKRIGLVIVVLAVFLGVGFITSYALTGRTTEIQPKETTTTVKAATISATTIQPTTTSVPQYSCQDLGYKDFCSSGYQCEEVKVSPIKTCCNCKPISVTTTTSTTIPTTTTRQTTTMPTTTVSTTTTLVTTTSTTTTVGSWNPVATFSGSAGKSTDTFYITGNKWRFTWSCESSSQYDGLNIFAYPEGETTMYVASIFMAKCSQGPDTYNVYEGPGSYYFDVGAANLDSWSINVESYH